MKQNQFATKVKDEENKYADSNTAQGNRKSAHSKRPPDGINTINNNINNNLNQLHRIIPKEHQLFQTFQIFLFHQFFLSHL